VGLFVLPSALVSGLHLSGADLAKAESDTRGNLVAAWTGLAIGLAGIGTYLTYRLNRRGQVTDRFGKAIDQLGNQSLAVQTGALYTLEQIVYDSPELHWPVMEVLFAYLNTSAARDRLGAPRITYPSVVGEDLQMQVKGLSLPSNVQAALTIIGRRDASRDVDGGVLNLRNLDLGDARLDRASLAARSGRPAKVNLRYAHLAGAHLRDARLASADLTQALLIDANLKGADLTGARLVRADLRLVHLDGVTLKHADLSGADLRSVQGLVAAQLTEAQWDAETRWPAGLVPPGSPGV
jgi:hypothetical protein